MYISFILNIIGNNKMVAKVNEVVVKVKVKVAKVKEKVAKLMKASQS